MTWFDIEPDWDYGNVEASTDGVTWTRLTQLSALPTATADLNGSSAWDGPGGFTGGSGGWQTGAVQHGQPSAGPCTCASATRPTTPSTVRAGTSTTSRSVRSSTRSTPPTAGPTNGWLFTTGLQNNDWTADAYVPFAKGGKTGYQVVPVLGLAGQGTAGSQYVSAQHQKSFKVYGIVSNHPDGTFSSLGKLTIAKGK